jgi:anti-anti-sigma factor
MGCFMLQVEIERSGDIAVARCTGRIVLGDDLHHLRVATLSQDTQEVRIDLSGITRVDAAALGTLVELHKRFQHAGRELKLLNPTPLVSQVLSITRLDTVLQILHTRRSEVARTNGGQRWPEFIRLAMTALPVAAAGLLVFSLARRATKPPSSNQPVVTSYDSGYEHSFEEGPHKLSSQTGQNGGPSA